MSRQKQAAKNIINGMTNQGQSMRFRLANVPIYPDIQATIERLSLGRRRKKKGQSGQLSREQSASENTFVKKVTQSPFVYPSCFTIDRKYMYFDS